MEDYHAIVAPYLTRQQVNNEAQIQVVAILDECLNCSMITIIPHPLLSEFAEPLFGYKGRSEVVCTSIDN